MTPFLCCDAVMNSSLHTHTCKTALSPQSEEQAPTTAHIRHLPYHAGYKNATKPGLTQKTNLFVHQLYNLTFVGKKII